MVLIEVIVILGLIFLNGYFALAEIALLSVKKSRLQYLAKQGNKKAKKALFLVRHTSEMLSTVQIAITAIGIFAGAFAGATVAEHLETWLALVFPVIVYSEAISVAFVVVIVTYLSLVIGELVPKQIALSNSEKMSLKVAGTIMILMKITTPLVRLLSVSTKRLLALLRIKPVSEQVITEEEIKLLIAEGAERGVFEQSEQRMVESIFHLGNRPIKDFITPSKEIVWLDVNDPIAVSRKKITGSDRSVFPVRDGAMNKNIGAIETKDIAKHLFDYDIEQMDLASLVQPVMSIDADTPSLAAIERLKESAISVALIVDKTSNEIIGIISFHDILEAIVGEFKEV